MLGFKPQQRLTVMEFTYWKDWKEQMKTFYVLRPDRGSGIPGMMKAQFAAISRCRTRIGKFSRDRRLLSQPAQSSHALPALVKASIASIRLGKTRKKGSNLVISNSCHTRGFTPLKAILLPDFWQLT